MSELEYTPEVLAKKCPVCNAAPGGKCLRNKTLCGQEFMDHPHVERTKGDSIDAR